MPSEEQLSYFDDDMKKERFIRRVFKTMITELADNPIEEVIDLDNIRKGTTA